MLLTQRGELRSPGDTVISLFLSFFPVPRSPESGPTRRPPETSREAESSRQLLDRLKGGDEDALDRLMGRYLVPLRRWAHGRLPPWARTMSDTQDLVQDAIVGVLRHLEDFEPDRTGALHSYLRKSVSNRILDELRHAHRVPPGVELDEGVSSPQPSPYDLALDTEDREIFEAALAELRDDDRELIIGRVEWGLSYEEIAAALGKPTPNAARVGVRRAVVRLAEVMNRKRHGNRAVTQRRD